MEAAAVAASAAAAAARDAALAASVAAAAAAKDAVAAAVSANEAMDAAKDAAAAASAAALTAKEAAATASAAASSAQEAAATASAAALDAKEAAAVVVTAGEAAAAAMAAMQASKKRKFVNVVFNAEEGAPVAVTAGEVAAAAAAAIQASKKCKFRLVDDDQNPPGRESVDDGEGVDFISRLPDAVLGTIVSLLPTRDGIRTQAISRRWRPLWRLAPLNLVDSCVIYRKGPRTIDLVPMILAKHPGPARRFSVDVYISRCYDKIGGWLSSQALDNLQELELTYNLWVSEREKQLLYLLPSPVYRFSPTLRVVKLSGCHLPDLIMQLSLKFPCLKQLTLNGVTTSEEALQSILSGCLALESLELKDNFGIARLCISSQTLKSIGFSSNWRSKGVYLQELVIESAPCLERLLPLDPKNGPPTIRMISASKLKILGALSGDIAELQLGTTVFQKMIAVGLATKIHTMRILVLSSARLNLDTVVNFLKCFPCLEKLYVMFWPLTSMNNVREYDPLDPVECLELHLKEVVLDNYDGTISSCIDFTKFFVFNAKMLKEMKITLAYHRQHKWIANQRSLLQIENRASRDAQIELKCGTSVYISHSYRYTHNLSIADPFGVPSSGCSKCTDLMRKKSLLL